MAETLIDVDLCIIGAGSAGLSVAAGAAQLGLSTVLIERGEMGGDCLNTGCVPSKALLAAGKRATAHRMTDIPGIKGHEPDIDFGAVKGHVAATIAAIAPMDSQERFEGFGVKVIRASARFVGPDRVEAGDTVVRARHFVVAAGSRASIPPISGLDPDKVLTNESVFDLRDRPDHLLIIGGGPIGIEMAQAHRRLGCRVTVVDMGPILPRDDAVCVDELRAILSAEGIDIREHVGITRVEHGRDGNPQSVSLTIKAADGTQSELNGSHLLVAAGRKASVDGLGLDAAGVAHDRSGIKTDARLRSSNKRVFAVGDIAGGPQFTHIAGYQAGIVIRNICFRLPAKVDYSHMPWVTYTDPELAQTGLTEAAARKTHGDRIRVVEWPFAENDRAIAEKATVGRVRIVALKNGRIVGASILGAHAGELIGLWALAISRRLKIGAVAGMILPYPTLSEAGKRAAGVWYTPTLFSDRTRRLVRWLRRLPF
ncbi:FAD-dependent oxidoreductase [Fodinicurvata sp. EGI_FJ10296]|uniref:dihydrolipoyl dehydrogenase family protein n=1 Tax=Fodinicurvata sp. EGI_FJ10296 TaxID=3231908 RepID=UPI0034527280